MEPGDDQLPQYPVISFSKENLVPGSESWISTCKNVKQAFEDHGFFVAVQDEFVTGEVSEGVFQGLEELFELPKETKIKRISDTIYYFGYQERIVKRHMWESSSIEDSTSLEAVEDFTKLMWPSGNKSFCDNVHLYAKKATELHDIVNRMVFESYGLGDLHKSCNGQTMTNVLRMMRYWPPHPHEPEVGAGSHSDKNWITIVHQNQINGLQVKPKNGGDDEWVTVDLPHPSLAVFAGDVLKAWSNGRIHSSVHRVVVHGKKTRYSATQFSYHTHETVQAPEELVDDDHPLLYKPFENYELVRFYSTPEGFNAKDILKEYCGV